MRWKALPWIVAAGFVLRVVFALCADNIHHPDEIFQYPEQAHRWVFGNGLVPWEFRFGTRSWLLPAMVALPLRLAGWLNLDRPVIYVPAIKILFCAMSVCVIPLVYAGASRVASEAAGRMAAITAALWYELVYFSFRPLPDTLAAYLLLAAVVVMLSPPSRRQATTLGALLALTVAFRSQLLPVAGGLGLIAMVKWTARQSIAAVIVAAGIVVACGLLDRVTWGGWFASYYNNFLFNAIHGVSKLFGQDGYLWYADKLVMASFGVFAIAGVWSVWWWRRVWLPIGVIVVIVAAHTTIGHKEYRFVFAVVPLAIILFGVVTALATDALRPARRRLARLAALAAIGTISIAGALNRLPGEREIYDLRPLFAADPSLRAYMRLADDPSLEALFVDDDGWVWSAGYYYLHRDVPMYFPRDVAAMRAESGLGVQAYASHVIHRGNTPETPGFALVSRLGPVEILRNVSRAPLRSLATQSRQMPQADIDGVYTPQVRPFLPLPK